MRVFVADKFEQSGLDGLRAAGCDVVFQPDLKDASLRDAISSTQADVLVVRGTAVTADMLGNGGLSLIVRAGAGIFSGGSLKPADLPDLATFRAKNRLVFVSYGSRELGNPRAGDPRTNAEALKLAA